VRKKAITAKPKKVKCNLSKNDRIREVAFGVLRLDAALTFGLSLLFFSASQYRKERPKAKKKRCQATALQKKAPLSF
jgi:hypothetical protein